MVPGTVDLTSRPWREAAGRMYERLGFRLRDARVYRLAEASEGPRAQSLASRPAVKWAIEPGRKA